MSHSLLLPSSAEMLEMDRRTIAAGVSSLDLMERAGAGCWKAIVASLPDTSLSRVVVLCGPGNNGGDGLIVARQMHQSGLRPIALLCSARRYSADCQAALSRALEAGLDVRLFGGVGPDAFQGQKITDQRGATELFAEATLVVDGLLGTGQVEAPRDSIAEILNCQASVKSNAQRVSIDLPTGVNCDTGLVYEPHFKADLTLAIQCIKRGLLQYPARSIAGKLQQIEIEIDTSSGCEFSQISTELLGRLEKRRLDSHKGTFGNVLIIGGCKRFPGAPVLSARAAARAGAGSVSKAHLSGLPFGDETPEVMPVPIDSGSEQVFKPSNISQLMAAISAAKACVVGPGLGTDPATGAFLTELFSKIPHSMPLVVDADALNLVASLKLDLKANTVITPHPGEAGRLLGISTEEVERDRYSAARNLAQRFHSVVVLKGAATIVYQGDRGLVNTRGTPFMATAGSGDVLAGIIAGLCAQGITPLEAASTGVLWHALSGEYATLTRKPCIASDIIEAIPKIIAERWYGE